MDEAAGDESAADAGRRPPEAAWTTFEEEVLGPPWGSIAKSELEFKVFRLLMATGSLDATSGDGHLAATLRVPASRVRSLRYRLDQESIGDDYLAAVVDRFEVHHVDGAPSDVHLVIDSRYLRERFSERLRSERIAVRRELAGELLRLEIAELVSFILMADDVPDADRERLLEALVPAWREKERDRWSTVLGTVGTALSASADAGSLTQGLIAALDKAF